MAISASAPWRLTVAGAANPLPHHRLDQPAGPVRSRNRRARTVITDQLNTVLEALKTAVMETNGATISVRALAHIIVGHERHHLDILQSRYGLPAK